MSAIREQRWILIEPMKPLNGSFGSHKSFQVHDNPSFVMVASFVYSQSVLRELRPISVLNALRALNRCLHKLAYRFTW